MDDAGTCPEPFALDGIFMPNFDQGVYAWSTVNESDFFRCGRGGAGSGAEGVLGLRARDDVEELEGETDLSELYDTFRGGNGGAVFNPVGGDTSK